MVAQFVTDLHLSISKVRLDTYRSPEGSDLDMLTNYFWNIELTEALVPPMHAIEVALRNHMHAVLTAHFRTDMWFYEDELLKPIQLKDFAFALRKVSKKPKPWPGRIVAELNFGFWVSLLNAPYDQRLWQPNGYDLLFKVFPNAVGQSRKSISGRFTAIKDLRNRAFHYEPIWHRSTLHQEHADIHQAIEWMSSTLHRAILAVDGFPNALNGRAQVEAGLRLHLGIPSAGSLSHAPAVEKRS